MAKAASNRASSRSQVTKDSSKPPSANKLPMLPVGESQSEAAEIETRRAVAIKRLESLHEESAVELLYMSQSVDGQGRPAGESRVSSVWPTGLDEWPGEDCRSLWQDTCDLVDAEFKSNEPDGGLSAWLFSRTQQKMMPTGIQAVVNDPLGKWLERLRSPDPTGPIVCSAMIVNSNPKAATAMDLLAVASKADVLAHVLRKQCEDVKRCETRIGDYRRDMRSESESLVELRDMFRRDLASQVRLLRIERSTLRHWTGDAEIILHYASALIPDELSKCRQLSARTWNRSDEADWDQLERELDLISSRLKWLPAPCGEKPPEVIHEPSKPVEPPTEAEFVFRPDGDGYFLKGFGESGHVSATRGMHDLYRLVQSPGIPVPMLELDAGPGVERAEGDGRSRQPVADAETLQQVTAKRKELKADIASANSNVEREESQRELDKLEASVVSMMSLNGKARDLNNPLDNLRSKILKRLRTAYDAIRDKAHLPKISEHFRLADSSESGCVIYRSTVEGLIWNTTDL